MIKNNNKNIYPIYSNNKKINRVYSKNKLVFNEGLKKSWWEEFGVRAEYIQNDGTQYINTGIVAQNNLSVDIEFAFTDFNGVYYGFGFLDAGEGRFNPIAVDNSQYGANFGYVNSIEFSPKIYAPLDTNFHRLIFNDINDGSISIDGNIVDTYNQLADYYDDSKNVLMFAREFVSVNSISPMKIKNCSIWDKNKILLKKLISIQVTKQFTDLNGITHEIGDWIMVNELKYKDVPTHEGSFTGKIKIDNSIYFRSISVQNPYYDLGRRIAYGKRIVISISFEDTGMTELTSYYGLFGSRSGSTQDTAYNTFITRNDLPNAKELDKNQVPLNRLFEITIENGKGYIDNILMSEDTGVVVNYDHNSFLYNINSVNFGGAMSTYRLPIGTNVYGCQIYDVETGVIENNYQPQIDQTLKCNITGEILPKLSINETDNWEVIDNTKIYKEIVAVRMKGDAYIDVNLPISYTHKISATVRQNYDTTTLGNVGRSGAVFSGGGGWIIFGDYGNGLLGAYFSKQTRQGATIPFDSNWHDYYLSNGLQKIDDIETNVVVDSEYSPINYYLGNFNNNYDAIPISGQDFVSFKVEGLRDLVAAKLLVDFETHIAGTVGMWDKINNKFYSSKTSTPLTEVAPYLTFNNEAISPYTVIGTWNTISKVEYDYSSTDISNEDVFLGNSYLTGYVGYVGAPETETMTVREQAQSTTVIPDITYIQKGNGIRKKLTFDIKSINTNIVTVGAYSDLRFSKSKKIYGFKVWDKLGNLVIDAVPKEFQTGGNFYNKVTNEFLPINGDSYLLNYDE